MDNKLYLKRKRNTEATKRIKIDWNKFLFAFYFSVIIPICFALLCDGLNKVWLQIILLVLIAITNKTMGICIWETASYVEQMEIFVPYISTVICIAEWGAIMWLLT